MGTWLYGQKSVNSPYSYYGLGSPRFAGSTESLLMGGVRSAADSTRVDVRNPASLSQLNLTAYTFGVSAQLSQVASEQGEDQSRVFAIDYLSLSFPVYKKLGVSAGLRPATSVGYSLQSEQTQSNGTQVLTNFEGNGGLSTVYLAAGYQLGSGLSFGASFLVNFGQAELASLSTQSGVANMIQEQSNSTYRGTGFNLGVQYQYALAKNYTLYAGASYTPKASLRSENTRSLTLFQYTAEGKLMEKSSQQVDLGGNQNTRIHLASEWNWNIGLTKGKKWFLGIDYTLSNWDEFSNPFISSTFVTYKKAHKIALGGYYIPQYNSFTSYWKRITYRAGMYYNSTGLELNSENINDFGISFGMSLPVRGFSNVTIGGVFGSKGTQAHNLIKEKYVGFRLGLTLNDKWFQKSKYN